MAWTYITTVKSNASLKRMIAYIERNDKTDYGEYVYGYECAARYAYYQFEITRSKTRIQKGNNLAWTIRQSFAPYDDVTPKQALEIGKELMRRMFPDYQYVIATHIDREHIHNHIVMCSVDFKTYHKLHMSEGDFWKFQKISDDICREYGLSVIERGQKNLRAELKRNIDDAIKVSDNFHDFVEAMQTEGYTIKIGKHIAFKNDKMKRYMRSSTIGIDYTEAGIKYRIESEDKEPRYGRRNKYDDKVIYRSKRQKLKAEIDVSLKKAKSYNEFLDDMRRKNFEVKEGVHLAFRGENQERFIRSESLGYHYTEEVLRFRFECEEEYKAMEDNRIGRVIDWTNFDGAMYNWACGENGNIENKSRMWIVKNITGGDDFGTRINFALFLEKYYQEKENISEQQQKIEKFNAQMRTIVKATKAIENYWRYKPIIQKYQDCDFSNLLKSMSLSEREEAVKTYNSDINKYSYSVRVMEAAKEQLGTVSLNELNGMLDKLKAAKHIEQQQLTRMKLNLETYEDIKYNFEHKCGWNISEEQAKAELDRALEQEQKKLDRKEKVRNFFGLNK